MPLFTFQPLGQFESGVEYRKWQQNILDLSDPRNIFLKPCFSNRPLPGMLVLRMTRLTRMARSPTASAVLGLPQPHRRGPAWCPPLPFSFHRAPPSPVQRPSGTFWQAVRSHSPERRRDSAGAGHREHRSPRPSSAGTFRAASFSMCVLATSLLLAVEMVILNFQLCF